MAMKTEEITFATTKSVKEIAGLLQQAAQKTKAQDIEKIDDSDPLAAFDDGPNAALSVVMSGDNGFFNRNEGWAVQVYVYEHGRQREVTLIALGDGFGGRLAGAAAVKYGGASGVQSLVIGMSRKKMKLIRQIIEG